VHYELIRAAEPTIDYERREAQNMAARWPLALCLATGANNSLDNVFAYLFLSAFRPVDPEIINRISLAGTYLRNVSIGMRPGIAMRLRLRREG
jgi:hypothetical protein